MNSKEIDQSLVKPDTSCMLINYRQGTASPTQWIKDLEIKALAESAQVVQVTNAEQQEKAVWAQASLARYIRAIQNAEEKAKAPLNNLRKKILDLSKELIKKADEEGMRVAGLVNEFQLAESRRVAASRRAQNEAASAIERERDQKLAVAPTVEQGEAIMEEYRDRLAAEAPPVPGVARANGQRITSDWEIVVNDIHLLYRHHPNAVKLTPLLAEIKMMLDEGTVPKGVTAKKIQKAGVRLAPEQKAIEI